VSEPLLVIGVGNAYRRDDGAGLRVARAIDAAALPGVEVVEESGEGASLLESWREARDVVLIDAVFSGAAPGTVYRLEVPGDMMPSRFFHYSTHAFSVAEAIELGRALDLLPARLVVFGIEGAEFGSGEGLSAPVRKAADDVVRRILEERTHARAHSDKRSLTDA
jgi:hydrogenase maturation protease